MKFTYKLFFIRLVFFCQILLVHSLIAQTTGEWEWTTAGERANNPVIPSSTLITSVCNDKEGNMYTCGYFASDSMVFGRGVKKVVAYNTFRVITYFLLKLDPQGDPIWVKTGGERSRFIGTNQLPHQYATSVTSQGNYIYMTGIFEGDSIHFNSNTIYPTTRNVFHSFIVKYDLGGNVMWVRHSELGHAGSQAKGMDQHIIVDKNDNVFVCGSYMYDSIKYGNLLLTSGITSAQQYIVKFNKNGNPLWAKNLGRWNSQIDKPISVDTGGNLIVCGFFKGSKTIGLNNLVSSGLEDIFLSKFDPNGDVIWAIRGGGNEMDIGLEVATDNENNIVISTISNSSDFEIGGSYYPANGNGLLIKFTPDGNVIWTRQIGTIQGPMSLRINNSNDIIYAGNLENSFILTDANVSLSCNGLSPHNYCDYFVKYSSAGIYQWSDITSTSYNGYTLAAYISVFENNLYVVGNFFPDISFGNLFNSTPSGSISSGPQNLFISKYRWDPLSTIEQNVSQDLKVSPNPSNGNFQISTSIDDNGPLVIKVFNLMGQLLLETKINTLAGKINEYINTTGLPSGMYNLEISNGKSFRKNLLITIN